MLTLNIGQIRKPNINLTKDILRCGRGFELDSRTFFFTTISSYALKYGAFKTKIADNNNNNKIIYIIPSFMNKLLEQYIFILKYTIDWQSYLEYTYIKVF